MRTNNRRVVMLARRGAAIAIAGASAYVAVRLWFSRDIVAWSLGGLVAACMFIGLILSRTVGLPSFHESDWEPSGILSLILEAAYLGGMARWLRSMTRRRRAIHEAFPPLAGSRDPRATTSA
jgi:hypothetical protein